MEMIRFGCGPGMNPTGAKIGKVSDKEVYESVHLVYDIVRFCALCFLLYF